MCSIVYEDFLIVQQMMFMNKASQCYAKRQYFIVQAIRYSDSDSSY